MRTAPILSGLLAILILTPNFAKAQALAPIPLAPTDFNPKAKVPEDLPKTLDIPKNMRFEVKVWRKIPIHYSKPPDPNSLDMLMDPDFEGAVIERGEEDVHITFSWEEGRTSEAFIIHGICFRKVNLAYSKLVLPSATAMNFWLNRQDSSTGDSDSFPGITWYSPSTFAGSASFDGASVLVFSQEELKPGTNTFPEANSVCLDPKTYLPLYMDDGARVFTFTYTPSPNVQINPQGPYLDAIQKKFGHYP